MQVLQVLFQSKFHPWAQVLPKIVNRCSSKLWIHRASLFRLLVGKFCTTRHQPSQACVQVHPESRIPRGSYENPAFIFH